MEDSISQNPESAEQDEEQQEQDMTALYPRTRGIKDEYAGEKLKDIADKAGFVGGIGSLVLGFLIGTRADNLAGFLIGLLVVGIGLFGSYVLAAVLRSYGDMVTNSFEQTRILRKLEEQGIAGLLVNDPEEANKQQTADMETPGRTEKIETEPAEPDRIEKANTESEESDDDIEAEPRVELSDTQLRNLALSRKLKMPLHGIVDRRMRRLAHFAERSRHGVMCPVCGRKQDSERNNCFYCDCRFMYDDEPFMLSEDDVLDRLRRLQAK